MTNKNSSWLLWIIPLIFICIAIVFATQMYPIYAKTPFYGQGPAYQYLFAGVDTLLGNVPERVGFSQADTAQVINSPIATYQALLISPSYQELANFEVEKNSQYTCTRSIPGDWL